jgi:hypothetical protein
MWTVTEPTAGFLFNLSNVVLICGAVAVLIGTIGAFAMGAAKEQFANERISANEAETARANAEAAQANESAAQAQLALAQLKAPRTLSMEQQQRIRAVISPYAGQQYALSVGSGTEPANLLCVVDRVLTAAGWAKHAPFGSIITSTDCGPAASNSLSGIHVRVAPGASQAVLQAENTLAAALIAGGLPARAATDPQNIPDAAVIVIMIGIKQ